MNIPIDIHTHHQPLVAGQAIENCYPETFDPQPGGWYSVGIHPWHIPPVDCKEQLEVLAHHPQVLAVGEAGLDKLAEAALATQIEVLEYQARLADRVGKPLVIHLVKAVDQLLLLKHTLRPSVPWIIHGFRGKATLAQTYVQHGFYLSFGAAYQAEALQIVPIHRLFIETDESQILISKLYRRIAFDRQVSLEELTQGVIGNVCHLFLNDKSCNFK